MPTPTWSSNISCHWNRAAELSRGFDSLVHLASLHRTDEQSWKVASVPQPQFLWKYRISNDCNVGELFSHANTLGSVFTLRPILLDYIGTQCLRIINRHAPSHYMLYRSWVVVGIKTRSFRAKSFYNFCARARTPHKLRVKKIISLLNYQMSSNCLSFLEQTCYWLSFDAFFSLSIHPTLVILIFYVQGASILGAAVSSASRVTSSVSSGRYLTLLVIDDQNTDWSKYFRGRRIADCDVRVEQAEFRELSVTATADGASVSVSGVRSGQKRGFRPDFLMVSWTSW